MLPLWASLSEPERAVFNAAVGFLTGRLEERATLEWTLRLKPKDVVLRLALLEVLNGQSGQRIKEPWRSAWRLIEETWNNPPAPEHSSRDEHHVEHRLRAGERSGSLVAGIVGLVAPRLKLELFPEVRLQHQSLSKRPRKVGDLLSTRLTSGKIIDPGKLGIWSLTDRAFLLSLAVALDGAVNQGLDLARRIGKKNEARFWNLGRLHRVYYVPPAERFAKNEPDEFHRGIAPSVKLLHAVVSRLLDIDYANGIEFVRQWKSKDSSVHMRLWAALSRNPRVTPVNEVTAFLFSTDDHLFWDLDYPEITELRAKRFGEMDPQEQSALTGRIRKGPSRKLFPRKVDADVLKSVRLRWSLRDLLRIELTGALLPKRDKAWLNARLNEFPDLAKMIHFEEGFPVAPEAHFVPPNPDSRYDLLSGEERLKALEAALSSSRNAWLDDPASRAWDWIRQPVNTLRLLDDFETVPDGGAASANVWDRFGWAHSTVPEEIDNKKRDMKVECLRTLSLIENLPLFTVREAIEGLSHWLSTWEKHVVVSPNGISIWLRLWPLAVEATNAQHPAEEGTQETVAEAPSSQEKELDTLNAPAGRLVGIFLAACPNLQENPHPFEVDSAPRRMRDLIISAGGRALLIARHRMIESLPYFLRADPDWANRHLIKPLETYNSDAIVLWGAIAHRTHFHDVLEIIGNMMTERATDWRLGRETRRSLVFSLVIECLYSFYEDREPAVPYTHIQQMLRSLDDEVRAYGAEAIYRFVRDVSARTEEQKAPPPAEHLIRSAVVPFLQRVWPQERSLATPGVSQALASLPAIAREAFAETVDTIERFLVPFECWSLFDYGLYGQEDDKPKLVIINSPAKAAALLRLLDLTIGTSEGAVVPYELADALDQIRKVTPRLADNQVFRRLATAARRG